MAGDVCCVWWENEGMWVQSAEEARLFGCCGAWACASLPGSQRRSGLFWAQRRSETQPMEKRRGGSGGCYFEDAM